MSSSDTTLSSPGKPIGGAGLKRDSAKPSLGLLPWPALIEITKVLDFGAKKYARYNWRAGFAWSRLYDALLRHIVAFIEGEDLDPESGFSHLAHAGCCLLFLLTLIKERPDLDDRYKKECKHV